MPLDILKEIYNEIDWVQKKMNGSLKHRSETLGLKNKYNLKMVELIVKKLIEGKLDKEELFGYKRSIEDDSKLMRRGMSKKCNLFVRILSVGKINSICGSLRALYDYILDLMELYPNDSDSLDYEEAIVKTKKYLIGRIASVVSETSILLFLLTISSVISLWCLLMTNAWPIKIGVMALSSYFSFYFFDRIVGLFPLKTVDYLEMLLVRVNACDASKIKPVRQKNCLKEKNAGGRGTHKVIRCGVRACGSVSKLTGIRLVRKKIDSKPSGFK